MDCRGSCPRSLRVLNSLFAVIQTRKIKPIARSIRSQSYGFFLEGDSSVYVLQLVPGDGATVRQIGQEGVVGGLRGLRQDGAGPVERFQRLTWPTSGKLSVSQRE